MGYRKIGLDQPQARRLAGKRDAYERKERREPGRQAYVVFDGLTADGRERYIGLAEYLQRLRRETRRRDIQLYVPRKYPI